MKLLRTRVELEAELATHPRASRAVVMTMGALHAGHAELIRAARDVVGSQGQVVVTVYVNPLQFNDSADLARYPRTLDADAEVAADAGANVVWAPTAADVFPDGEAEFATDADVFVTAFGSLSSILEGAARPGHFTGMLTVVRALLAATNPGYALFGEKDYQQLALIRRMVASYEIATTVIGVPTVREADGLAMSSRNQFLNESERNRAVTIHRALHAGAAVAVDAHEVVAAAEACLATAGLTPDYLTVIGEDFVPVPEKGDARLLVACRVGDVRLIDNMPIHLRPVSQTRTSLGAPQQFTATGPTAANAANDEATATHGTAATTATAATDETTAPKPQPTPQAQAEAGTP